MSNDQTPELTAEDWKALTTFFELLIQADQENLSNKI